MHTTAFVGCAHIHTPGFIKRINARHDVTVKHVWDHETARAERCAGELGAIVTTEVETIFSDSDVDSVVICAETNRHLGLVIAAADAGKHMFVEKPLGLGASDAAEMAQAIETAGVTFQTGYFMRGNPVHQFLRDQIQRGSFGSVTRFRHTNFHSGSLKDMFTPEWLWMTRMEEAGIGAFGDLGTHSLDIMMWLFGDIIEATATLSTVTGTYGNLDETGEALLRFEKGVIGSLGGGWVDVIHPVPLILSGTEGHAFVKNDNLYVECANIDGADGRKTWLDLPEPWPHAFDLFFDAVATGADVSLVTPTEAAARSAVMEALYQSAADHAWIQLRDPV